MVDPEHIQQILRILIPQGWVLHPIGELISPSKGVGINLADKTSSLQAHRVSAYNALELAKSNAQDSKDPMLQQLLSEFKQLVRVLDEVAGDGGIGPFFEEIETAISQFAAKRKLVIWKYYWGIPEWRIGRPPHDGKGTCIGIRRENANTFGIYLYSTREIPDGELSRSETCYIQCPINVRITPILEDAYMAAERL